MNKYLSKYTLPYNITETESLILLADKANQQAQQAYDMLSASLHTNKCIKEDILASTQQDRSIYSASVINSGNTAAAAAKAAINARQSEEAALAAALKIFREKISAMEEQIPQQESSLAKLVSASKALRAEVDAMDAETKESPDGREKAQLLLEQMKSSYNDYQSLQKNRQELEEYRACFRYIIPQYNSISSELLRLEDIQESVKLELDQYNIYFGTMSEAKTDAEACDSDNKKSLRKKGKNTRSEKKNSGWSVLFSYLKIIAAAILLAFLVRAYFFDITQVSGLSMYSSLNEKDMLVTSKISYAFNDPQRGDIIVFDAPDSVGEDYIKRIIALPNEEIRIEAGMVYINGELLEEDYLDGVYTEGNISMVIPDGFYFVMGDNRTISRDSRNPNVGVISKDGIHGKAVLRIFPLNSFGSLD